MWLKTFKNLKGICILLILTSCSKFNFQTGIYLNKLGEQLKFNSDSTFEYFYHDGVSKLEYSSGSFKLLSNKVRILTDSTNLPFIKIITSTESYSNLLTIDDEGYAEKSKGTIKYDVIINDTIILHATKENAFDIGRIREISTLQIVIISIPQSDVYGAVHKTPIYSNKYFLQKNDFNKKYLYKVNLVLETRMFYVSFFDSQLKLTKKGIGFPHKYSFFYCPKCIWNKSAMSSPAIK